MSCMCEFGGECNGLGTLHCAGCGGDLCVCVCGGETECDGCVYCGEDALGPHGVEDDDGPAWSVR